MLKLLIILFIITTAVQSQGVLNLLENSIHHISFRSLRPFSRPIHRSPHWVDNNRKSFQQNPFSFQGELCSVLSNSLNGKLIKNNSFFKHNDDLMNHFIFKEHNGILIPHKNVILGISPKEIIEKHKMNGIKSSLYHFNDIMPFDFPYVSLISQNHNLIHDFFNPKEEIIHRTYVTPLHAAMLYQTVGEFQKYNAVKCIWNSLSDGIFGYFKKGDKVELLLSLTAPQRTTEEEAKEQAEYLGVPSYQLTESLCGGGVQLCIIHAPSHCYALKERRIIQGLYAGRNKENGLFENPINIRPQCISNKKIRSHLQSPTEWHQERLYTYDFLE